MNGASLELVQHEGELVHGATVAGPGSSSMPGTRSHALQPRAGMDLTRQHEGLRQRAALPPWSMPPNHVQCQQGMGAPAGVECEGISAL